MKWSNAFTDIFKLQYPIIQAPMLGVSTPEMAAAVSNEGGLGSLAVGGLSPEVTRQLIRKTRDLTNKPFAVNLFAHSIPPFVHSELAAMKEMLLRLAERRGYDLHPSDLENLHFYSYHDQLDVLIQERTAIVSFTFGCPDNKAIKRFKSSGSVLIGTATCVSEADYLKQQEIDMIVVQGIEAGGHRGSFLDHFPLPEIGLFSLLPQIVAAVDIPCIAAGGINSGQTMKAAFALGAAAVQIGSAFIGTEESQAIPSYKQILEHAKDTDSVLTRAFSGRWARGIKNKMIQEIEASGIAIPPYPFQNSLTTAFRKLAQRNNDSEYTTLWAGQSAGRSHARQAKQVLIDLVKEYEAAFS